MRRHHLILLLDHDPRRLSCLKLLLETHGYRVLASQSAESALEQLSAQAVEMLVTFRRYPVPASTQPLTMLVSRDFPRTSIVFRERQSAMGAGEEPERFRTQPPPELSPAELLDAIRKEFSRRRGPQRAAAAAAAAAS